MNNPVKTFFDLNAWQAARKLTRLVYEKTNTFPADERFGLTSQVRRASVSVMANIAEGFGRISVKEKLNFYNQAFGSSTEIQSHMVVAMDMKFISDKEGSELMREVQNSQALLQGLIRSTRKRLVE